MLKGLYLCKKNMFTIEYYKKEQFHLLKDKWEELERGTDMTPYQNYDGMTC